MKKYIFIIFLSLLLFPLFIQSAYASLKGEIISNDVEGIVSEGMEIVKQRVVVEVGGENQEVVVEGLKESTNIYEVGERVLLNEVEGKYIILDYDRSFGITILSILFVLFAVAIARKYGVYSILSMIVSFLVILNIIIPRLVQGDNPVLVVVLSSLIIIPVTFYASHGFSMKTTIAVVSTILTLIITGLVANYFINLTYLRGLEAEESLFLQLNEGLTIDLKGLLLAGMIISLLGVLDDVTVSQASVVEQLDNANSKLGFSKLFSMSLTVGKDHISSMINTLVLVYTGSALPLVMLISLSDMPFWNAINPEFISTEIVRTLVGSLGIIMAIPVVTFIASYYYSSNRKY